MSGWTTLVQAETLAIALHRKDLAVVDCRHSLANPLQGQHDYMQGHVPGAVYAHLEQDLSDMSRHGEGRHPWPDASDFVARLGRWGIQRETQVVAYDAADGAFAARLWFLLRALGHERVAVLDGGWRRWVSLGLQVETGTTQPLPQAYGEAAFDPGVLADAAQVAAHVAAGGLLVDARSRERFQGDDEPIDRVAGHVPGATNRPYAENLAADGRFKAPMQLAEEWRTLLNGRAASDVVAMCGSGVTACHHLLALERSGLRGARLYPGSWSGWISDPDRPVATR